MFALAATCSPYRYHIDLVRRLTYTEQRAVAGVTTLNNKIFVVYHELSFIVVYMSQDPYTRLANTQRDRSRELNKKPSCR